MWGGVMNDPTHEVTIPLVKAVSAECLACFSLGEHSKAMGFARACRGNGYHEDVHFWLSDAAEWRKVYQACIRAIDDMGGL